MTCNPSPANTYTKVTLKDTQGDNYNMCTNNWCYNCAACTATNCLVCDWKLLPTQCKQCAQDYYLDGSNQCVARNGQLTIDLFVKSFTGFLMSPGDLTAAKNADGSLANPFWFLQEAYYQVLKNKNVEQYMSVTVYVWVGKGNHFFF